MPQHSCIVAVATPTMAEHALMLQSNAPDASALILIYVSCKLSTFIVCHVMYVTYSACHVYYVIPVCHDECMSCMMRLCISIGFSDDRRFSLGKVRICVNTKRRQVEAEKGRSLGVAVSFFPLYVVLALCCV